MLATGVIEPQKRRVGRPKGSKKKDAVMVSDESEVVYDDNDIPWDPGEVKDLDNQEVRRGTRKRKAPDRLGI